VVGDPLPCRQGLLGAGGGILTRREFDFVVEIMRDAEQEKRVYYSPAGSEDRWTAFVSLLRGGYIRDAAPQAQKYVLTARGKQYLAELRS
jgi:hypothetical protein